MSLDVSTVVKCTGGREFEIKLQILGSVPSFLVQLIEVVDVVSVISLDDLSLLGRLLVEEVRELWELERLLCVGLCRTFPPCTGDATCSTSEAVKGADVGFKP